MDHPEIDLEKELNKPVSELTRKFYRDILQSMEKTNVQSRAILAEVQEMLVEIAGIVNSPWMHEQRGEKMRDPRSIRISELIPIVRQGAINAHIEMTRIRESNKDIDDYEVENKRLASQVDRLERENAAHQQAWENQQTVIENLKRQLADNQRPGGREEIEDADTVTLALDDESLDAHYQRFILEKLSTRAFFAIGLIGDQGEILSPQLRKNIAEKFFGDPEQARGEEVTEILELLDEYGLIQRFVVKKPGRPGRPPETISLKYAGIYFYEKHSGKKYISPEYIRSHKSQAQALLVMEAEALLREAGYEIHQSHVLRHEDGSRQFLPDITASKDGTVIYCEVERNTPKANQSPDAKWRNFRHYTNGQMYVFFRDKQCQTDAIRYATVAMQNPNDNLWLCDVTLARQNLKEKGVLWTSVHRGR